MPSKKDVEYLINDPDLIQTVAFWTEQMSIKDIEVELTVASTPLGLCWLGLGPLAENERSLRVWMSRWYPEGSLIRKHEPNRGVFRQLQEYLTGMRKAFTLPLHQIGTPFQLQVWEELRRIPYGKTISYGELALKVGNPKGQRAVGMANHRNPIGIVVPCHRVIGKNGNLTGYAGGLDIKQRLLELEGTVAVLASQRT